MAVHALNRRPTNISKRLSPGVAMVLALSGIHRSTTASAFSFAPVTIRATIPMTKLATKRTVCNAKIGKIASSFDLDEILSNEKEFASVEDETISAFKSKSGNKRNNNKDKKKKMMKENLKQERLGKQQLKKKQKDDALWLGDTKPDSDDDTSDEESSIDYANLIKNIDFAALEVPTSLDGKRIDVELVELLNKVNDDGSNPTTSISRSQCGTLLSHECVFVVSPENATNFQSAWEAHKETATEEGTASVPHSLIEQHSSPISRKSHALEMSSILIYPSRDSLLSSSSSSTLLSNFLPPNEIIAQNIPLDVLYEDEHMIVINKQAGMVVHPAAGNWDGTVVNALSYYLMNVSPFGGGEFFADPEKEKADSDDLTTANSDDAEVNRDDAVTNSVSTLRPGIVHRLDKGTTGVMVMAKTSSALATLSASFKDRTVKKQYVAVAIGNPGEDQSINKPIARHPVHRQRMRVVPDPNSSMYPGGQARLTGDRSPAMMKLGKPALSHIHTIHYDGKLSVVEIKIATGRTHQIRVHLQDHGTPVYGDDVYGMSDWNKALSARRGVIRPLLHAQRLEINHPVTGETMVFEAKVADDMMGVIKSIWPAGEKIEF